MNSLELININKGLIKSENDIIIKIFQEGKEKSKIIFNNAIQETEKIERDCKIRSSIIQEKINEKAQENKKLEDKVKKITTFETYYICNLIAKLISEIEGEEYIFTIPGITKRNVYGGRYGYEYVDNFYYGLLITKKSRAQGKYDEEVYSNDKMSLEKRDDCILIDLLKSYQIPSKISIWEKFNDTVVSQRFNYIFDFINDVVSYSEENNIDILSEEDVNNIYNSFIERNKSIIKIKKY